MGFFDFISGSSKPTKTWAGPGHNWSYDWCRFRKNSRCMYATDLNKAASELAGYSVWVPLDRGYCPRILWDDQKTCSVGEPGPHAPGGFTDATISWEDGGQRGGKPAPNYRANVTDQSVVGEEIGNDADAVGPSLADSLAELGRLHDSGQLTDAEFSAAKRKALGS